MALVVGGTTVTGTQTLDATKLTGNLPAISGASLTGITAGITVADEWRLTTSFTGDAAPIASNWEQADTTLQGQLGSAMTQSSGVFSFPSTGFWLVKFHTNFYDGTDRYLYGYMHATNDDGSNWAIPMETSAFLQDTSGAAQIQIMCTCILDITNVSNDKVRFSISSNSVTCQGSSVTNVTGAQFIRLGDT